MIRCKKCGNNLKEHGKDFDIHLTPEQEKELQRNILPTEILQEMYFNIICLKCNTILNVEDLCEKDDIVYCKTAEDIEKHMPEVKKITHDIKS